MFLTMTTEHHFHSFLIIIISLASAFAQSDVGSPCVIKLTEQPGICKISTDCPVVQQQAQNGISPTICGFSHLTIPIVCCERDESAQPNENSFVNRPSSEPELIFQGDSDSSPPQAQSISEQKCQEYSKSITETLEVLPLLSNTKPVSYNVVKCEYNGVALIVGGKPALAGEFPFMAAIGYGSLDSIEWRCGGTLISEYYIVTAAHCNTPRDPPIVARLGDLDLANDNDGSVHRDYNIRRVINHPQYRRPSKYNDIALIELTERVTFTKYIRPACLNRNNRVAQSHAVATGWGKTDFASDLSSKLRKVSLKLQKNEVCERDYTNEKNLAQGISHSMLCAGDHHAGRDTCQGDSGGPLLVTTKDNKCKFYIIGVTSFGKYCGEKPAVYTRISSFVSWIEQTVWS